MKETERQNEMDILLRGMAKQANSFSESGNGGKQTTAHLDADELNAFAERTLPPLTQARYTSHLVDCSQCRRLIAQLSAAAGLPIEEVKSEKARASFWQRLPAFLSPAVLRFAVPALGILAVITIGIITFRQQQQRSAELVAQNQEPIASRPATTTDQKDQTAGNATQPQIPLTPAPVPTAAPEAKSARTREETATVDKVTTADSGSGVSSGLIAKDAPKPSKSDADEAQPAFAPEPAAPAAPPVARAQVPAKTAENKNEALAKEKAATVGVVSPQTRDQRPAAAEDREVSPSRKVAAAGRGGAATNAVRRSETEQAKRADQSEDITEVAGRRFRKQGNTWIDTAYDSSRPAITVVRGTEQYRALVADEPGIRTIAERLAGEVLVVWKGRIYRIR
jgi:hypothetical protein